MVEEDTGGPGYATPEYQENLKESIRGALLNGNFEQALSLASNIYQDGRPSLSLADEDEIWTNFTRGFDGLAEEFSETREHLANLAPTEALAALILNHIEVNEDSKFRPQLEEDLVAVMRNRRKIVGEFVTELAEVVKKYAPEESIK